MKKAVVFGAGVAGLSAAHELARLGYQVTVYEAHKNAGGFFRSDRNPDNNMPTEYSWHGIAPWYHNVLDIMKQIPFDESRTIYEASLSRPINFGIAPDVISKHSFNVSHVFKKPKAFRMSLLDKIFLAWLLLKTWTAHHRTSSYYATLNAAEQWKSLLTHQGWSTWKATFGPWIGSDWTNVSLHHVGQFFRKNLMSGKTYYHHADQEGPAWEHGSGNGWLLLRGPSNEFWFDKWVAHLKQQGVVFYWEESLFKLDYDGTHISAAHLESGTKIQADMYVLAINPFYAARIIKRTPPLECDDQLRLFAPLTDDKPHTQVSFRIAFSEVIKWPVERAAVIVADSEFNITLFAQEQVWAQQVDLGDNVKSLWTGTACAATVPGRLFKLPLIKCTKEQFIQEIIVQLESCQGLDFLIKKANDGRGFKDFKIMTIEVWHEWLFNAEGIICKQPKWVNNTRNQQYLPSQKTGIKNLVVCGAHTKTTADLWSIEAAVESGRLAVKVVEPNIAVLSQYKNIVLRFFSTIDDWCFALGVPHILDVLLAGVALVALWPFSKFLFSVLQSH